jgi:hypothetical protein
VKLAAYFCSLATDSLLLSGTVYFSCCGLLSLNYCISFWEMISISVLSKLCIFNPTEGLLNLCLSSISENLINHSYPIHFTSSLSFSSPFAMWLSQNTIVYLLLPFFSFMYIYIYIFYFVNNCYQKPHL